MSESFTVWAKQVQADMEVVLDRHLPPASALPSKLHEAMRYAVPRIKRRLQTPATA